jgi:hypothetical protein
MNQTAHISLQLLSISNSVETKVTVCALTCLARPASDTSNFLIAGLPVGLRFRFRLVRLASRWCLLAPPVRGVLRLVAHTRNPFFEEICFFYETPDFPHVFGGLRQFKFADLTSACNFLVQKLDNENNIWGYPQVSPQDGT